MMQKNKNEGFGLFIKEHYYSTDPLPNPCGTYTTLSHCPLVLNSPVQIYTLRGDRRYESKVYCPET